MRILFTLLTFTFFLPYISTFGQAPNGINYQGIARDGEGKPLSQREISIQISILKGAANGDVEYDEIHEVRTNNYGLFTLVIGKGTPGTGTFNFISWATGEKWLQIELDENGGRNFKLMGSQQLMSVPYALYAEYAGNGYAAGQGINISNNMISNVGDNDNNPTNELITGVSLTSGNKLQITDAGGTKEVDLNGLVGSSQNLTNVLSIGNDAGANTITNLSAPASPNDAATKAYVDSHVDGDASATNEIQNLGQVLSQGNDAGNSTITNLGTPTTNSDATTKLYVDNLDAADGDKSSTNEIQNIAQVLAQNNNTGGAKITGLGAPTVNSDAATKLYVDNLDAADGDKSATNEIQNLGQVLAQGGDAGGTKITNLGAPTANSDAATKKYVDDEDAILASKISTTYAFKATFDYTNLSGVIVSDQTMPLTSEDFDDFNVLGATSFTAKEDGTYVFMVDGYYSALSAGGTLNLLYNSVKYPITIVIPFGATQPRYSATLMFKLTIGQTVSLVADNIALLGQFNGKFFGYKL